MCPLLSRHNEDTSHPEQPRREPEALTAKARARSRNSQGVSQKPEQPRREPEALTAKASARSRNSQRREPEARTAKARARSRNSQGVSQKPKQPRCEPEVGTSHMRISSQTRCLWTLRQTPVCYYMLALCIIAKIETWRCKPRCDLSLCYCPSTTSLFANGYGVSFAIQTLQVRILPM